jgi:hypothetical protein
MYCFNWDKTIEKEETNWNPSVLDDETFTNLEKLKNFESNWKTFTNFEQNHEKS